MSISAHAVRRAVVAVAASGAAVLSMTAASAAAHHERGLAGTPICSVARLRVSVGQGSGTAGAVVYPLRFTNLSRVTCHLNGYPGVAAVGRHGHQLGSPASRDTTLPAPLRHAAPWCYRACGPDDRGGGQLPVPGLPDAYRRRPAGLPARLPRRRVRPADLRGLLPARPVLPACHRGAPGPRLGAALVAHPPGGTARRCGRWPWAASGRTARAGWRARLAWRTRLAWCGRLDRMGA